MSAEPVKKCPTCGKKKARRLIGAGGGLIFKGTGFYITDYRSENYKKGASADSSSSSGAAKSDAGSAPKSDSGAKSGGGKSGE